MNVRSSGERVIGAVLLAGVSVGAVTAGVVGARKPQYDIWGGCVNAARSLQRTSLPNCIHVNKPLSWLLSSALLHVGVLDRSNVGVVTYL